MRLLQFQQLKSEKNVPFTRQHIRRLQKAGTFPLPIPLGENTTAYLEKDIDDWLTSRVAERDVQQRRQALPAAAEPPVAGAGSARGRRKQAPAHSAPLTGPRALTIEATPRR